MQRLSRRVIDYGQLDLLRYVERRAAHHALCHADRVVTRRRGCQSPCAGNDNLPPRNTVIARRASGRRATWAGGQGVSSCSQPAMAGLGADVGACDVAALCPAHLCGDLVQANQESLAWMRPSSRSRTDCCKCKGAVPSQCLVMADLSRTMGRAAIARLTGCRDGIAGSSARKPPAAAKQLFDVLVIRNPPVQVSRCCR